MKYKIVYLAKDKDNAIPFDLLLRAINKEKAHKKINKLFEKYSKINKCEYKLLSISEVKKNEICKN